MQISEEINIVVGLVSLHKGFGDVKGAIIYC